MKFLNIKTKIELFSLFFFTNTYVIYVKIKYGYKIYIIKIKIKVFSKKMFIRVIDF